MNKIEKRKSPLFKDLRGLKFGKLLVKDGIIKTTKSGINVYHWICDCDCGGIIEVRTTRLYDGTRNECASCIAKKTNEKRIIPNNGSLINKLIRNYKTSAKKRNISFELNNEQFKKLIKSNCYYCNSEPIIRKGEIEYAKSGEFKRNGIDRLNNDIGYTIENSVPCCEICNRAKLKLTEKVFLNHIEKIYLFKIKKNNK